MASTRPAEATVHVENLGGIDDTTVSFEPGITVLAGRNATNRTSFLRSVMAALGSDRASLKAGAERGRVELEYGEETYTRTFRRESGTVVTGGDPYLTDPDDRECAELFAFLLESNEARRGVAEGADLRELIMRPVDTVAIQEEIRRTQRDRDRIDEELSELDDLADRLPTLETRRQELESEIEEVEDELAEKREELDAADANVEARQEERSELDDAMNDLQAARNEYTRTRQRIETERESVASLEDEREELQADLEDFPDGDAAGDFDDRLDRLRSRQARLDDVVSELQSVIEFNERMVEGADGAVAEALRDDEASGPADELLPDDEREVTCWTCGSSVQRGAVEDTLERLRSVRQDTLAERSEVRSEIQELSETKRERRERARERERLENRLDRTESELAERRERIEDLEATRADLDERIEDLEDRVTELQAEEQDELLDLNRAVNELEFERDQLAGDRDEVETEIAEIESRLEDRPDLEDEREAVADRLEELRNRIDRLEESAVEAFNEHMERLLDLLGYDNLARIWIERKRTGDESRFDLHVVRADESGTAHSDAVRNLSESEREVTGLVFALAGYLVHDVHEVVPFMVLDSLEAIDAERIATLVEYFGEYADSVLVALLPEDAAALDDDYHRVREI